MIKAVLFDADNTLYRISKSEAYDAQFAFLQKATGIKKQRIKSEWEKVRDCLRSSPDPELRNRKYSTAAALHRLEYDSPDCEKVATKSVDIFNERIVRNLKFDKENRTVLSQLRKKYRLAVASDEFASFLKMKLNRALTDYRKYFSFIITPEKTKAMKPSTAYYELAIKRLGMKAQEVMMVGDSWERDLKPAASMGMKTVLVGSRIEGKPNHWVKNIAELRRIL